MEGSCCVAVLQAAPARDAPCPPHPRMKWDVSSRVRGTGKSLVKFLRHGPAVVVPWPEGHQGGRDGNGHDQEAEGVCFFLVDWGIYCCLGIKLGRC